VGERIAVLRAAHQLLPEPSDVRIHERLPPRDRDHRRAALLDRGQALLDAQVLPENVGRVLDLAAASTGQVTAVERLEHQHEWVTAASAQPLTEDVRRDRHHLRQRNTHARWFSRPSRAAGRWGTLHTGARATN